MNLFYFDTMISAAAKYLLPRVVPSSVVRTAPLLSSTVRFYRGDSGEATPRSKDKDAIGQREAELIDLAKPKYDAIQSKHVAMPDLTSIAKGAFGDTDGSTSDDVALDVRRKRLIYRAKQRGWLEVDLLLGTWASENVLRLEQKDLDEFEDFVNMETIDIYNIVTLRTDVPENLKGGVVERIQDWARKSPLGKADPVKYKEVKQTNNLI